MGRLPVVSFQLSVHSSQFTDHGSQFTKKSYICSVILTDFVTDFGRFGGIAQNGKIRISKIEKQMKTPTSILFVLPIAICVLFSCAKEETQTNQQDVEDVFVTKTLTGEFSVSLTKKVRFSQGNLQYKAVGTHPVADGGTAVGKWRFANNQWDVIGETNSQISRSYNGWIDLFGWGTSGYHNPDDTNNVYNQPYSRSDFVVRDSFNYYGYGPSINMPDTDLIGTSAYYDWGIYNTIVNGGENNYHWRTLTRHELDYLLDWRQGHSEKRGKGTVNGVNGLILLPDNWTLPEGLTFVPGNDDWLNTYDVEQWTLMEEAGAVFLPAAGIRLSKFVGGVNYYGNYWLVNSDSGWAAFYYEFNQDWEQLTTCLRYYGHSVRLVKDVD